MVLKKSYYVKLLKANLSVIDYLFNTNFLGIGAVFGSPNKHGSESLSNVFGSD